MSNNEFTIEITMAPGFKEKLAALREAWIEAPFDGVCPPGLGDWLQKLMNAVTAIVDPDRKLRDEPEVKRSGTIASFRSQLAWADGQVKAATTWIASGETAEQLLEQWTARRAEILAQCKAELGVDLDAEAYDAARRKLDEVMPPVEVKEVSTP